MSEQFLFHWEYLTALHSMAQQCKSKYLCMYTYYHIWLRNINNESYYLHRSNGWYKMQISDFSTRRPEQVLILCWFRNTTECCDSARMLRVQQQQRPSSFADAFLCSYKVNAEQNVTWNCTSNKMSRSTTFNNLLDGHQLMTFNITVYYFMEINLLKWSSFIESLSW